MTQHRFNLNQQARQRIAAAFLPSRGNYYYVRCKLASDPLYEAVIGALAASEAPILDLGCGMGLLAQVLAAAGVERPYLGLDNDAEKIRRAETAAKRADLRCARFACVDLSVTNVIRDLHHHGSVAMLDLLQYVKPDSQAPILEQAAAAVSPCGRLVIRTGFADKNWRTSLTHFADNLGHRLGWMNVAPKSYPDRASLQALLTTAGLTSACSSLRGKSPFNNWLIQASRTPTLNHENSLSLDGRGLG